MTLGTCLSVVQSIIVCTDMNITLFLKTLLGGVVKEKCRLMQYINLHIVY